MVSKRRLMSRGTLQGSKKGTEELAASFDPLLM